MAGNSERTSRRPFHCVASDRGVASCNAGGPGVEVACVRHHGRHSGCLSLRSEGYRRLARHSKIRPLMSALGQKQTSAHVRVMSALPPKADIGTQSRNVRFVPNADYQRSISPNTMSRELSIAGTSASMCPRVKKSIAPKCGYDGARILHLYGWLVPSETR